VNKIDSESEKQNLEKNIWELSMTDWTEIKTQNDADSFMKRVNHFHDFYLKNVHIINPRFMGTPTSGSFFFQNTWGGVEAFELFFEEVTRINFIPSPPNFDSLIMRSILRIDNKSIMWCEDSDLWNTGGDNERLTWVTAHKLSWKPGDQQENP
jgi:hypothetical protein